MTLLALPVVYHTYSGGAKATCWVSARSLWSSSDVIAFFRKIHYFESKWEEKSLYSKNNPHMLIWCYLSTKYTKVWRVLSGGMVVFELFIYCSLLLFRVVMAEFHYLSNIRNIGQKFFGWCFQTSFLRFQRNICGQQALWIAYKIILSFRFWAKNFQLVLLKVHFVCTGE